MKKLVKNFCLILIFAMISQVIVPVYESVAADVAIVIEAESISATSGFSKENDSATSGGAVMKTITTNIPSSGSPVTDTAGALIYSYKTTTSGYYNVWIRSKSDSSGSDSVWYMSNSTGGYENKDFTISDSYGWSRMERVYLTPGTQSIRFLPRERNFRLDKIIITKDGSYIPSGVSGENNYAGQKLPDIYGSPKVYPPENEHPRVLVREGWQLDEIRANLTHPQNVSMYERVQYYAKLDKTGTLPQNSNNYSENELAIAESCAFLYLLDKDANVSYGQKAVTNIKNICDTTILTANSFPTRAAGHTIYITALVYDWCYDLLSETDKKMLIGYIINLATTMEIGWPATKQGNFVGHGSEAQLLKDLFSAAIAIYDEYPEFYELVGGRLYNEMIPAREFMYKGHYFQVGSGYGPERYTCDMWNAFLLKAIGDETSYSEDQKYMMYEMIYNRRPDGAKAVYGDYYDEINGYNTTDLEGFFLAANYYQDPKLKKEFYRINPDGTNFYSSGLSISPVLHLIANDVYVEVESFEDLPLTALYEGSNGTMIARSSWEDGKESDPSI